MKNIVIAFLASYIFYTDFCIIKMPVLFPFMVFVCWLAIEATEDLIVEYRHKLRRGAKLQRKVRRLILSKRA